MVRATVLDIVGQDFVGAISAKGLTRWPVIRRIAKNAAPSVLARMSLLPDHAHVTGQVWLSGREILGRRAAELPRLRGGAVSMIFQEPMAALDPVYTIGAQIAKTIIRHEGCDRHTAMQRPSVCSNRSRSPRPNAA